jgi:hypothetical protein
MTCNYCSGSVVDNVCTSCGISASCSQIIPVQLTHYAWCKGSNCDPSAAESNEIEWVTCVECLRQKIKCIRYAWSEEIKSPIQKLIISIEGGYRHFVSQRELETMVEIIRNHPSEWLEAIHTRPRVHESEDYDCASCDSFRVERDAALREAERLRSELRCLCDCENNRPEDEPC